MISYRYVKFKVPNVNRYGNTKGNQRQSIKYWWFSNVTIR